MNAPPKELVIYMLRRSILPALVLLFFALGWVTPIRGWPAPEPGLAGAALAAVRAPEAPPQGRGTAAVEAPPLQPPPLEPAPGNPVAVISTSLGDFTIELFKEQAPVSVENFLRYVSDGFYEGTVFHRVVSRFMIQGGGYTPELVERPTREPIQNEATNGLRNLRGTLAMARKQSLRSATSQFYVNLADNRMLDHTGYTPVDFGYAVFGRVLQGMDVVDRIGGVKTGARGGMDDVPLEPVVITKVRVQQRP